MSYCGYVRARVSHVQQEDVEGRTVVVDQAFHISHDLGIATMDDLGHYLQRFELIVLFVGSCRLRIENEGDCKQALKRREEESG